MIVMSYVLDFIIIIIIIIINIIRKFPEVTKHIFLVALKPKGIDSALETCYRLTTFNVSTVSRQLIPVAEDPLGKEVSLPCGKPMSL